MAVLWLDEIDSDDLDTVGGKAASLGEMTGAGLPVPPAFVVTAGTYRRFIEDAGIEEELFAAVDVDHEDSDALADAAERAEELILGTEMPAELREEILAAYDAFEDDPFVAVRSSATAEDLPDASFAGQQETFLNVQDDGLVRRVKECWASLFTQRAIYYRNRQGFPHDKVDIAVVVQRMVDADKSGVMFTSHPSTGAPQVIIEAAWGLGEAVVSGSVSPDNYEIDRETGEIETVSVADKKTLMERDANGETVEREVAEERRREQVLTDGEIADLLALGRTVEDHYGDPQDVEWAIRDGEVYMLQSRPITTISDSEAAGAPPAENEATGAGEAATGGNGATTDATTTGTGSTSAAGNTPGAGDGEAMASGGVVESEEGDVLVSGLGASPGMASGTVRIVNKLDELDKVADGDVIVTEMTMPDMVPAMKRAVGIVTDEGGMTSHAAIVSRELGVPAVVGTGSATHELSDGQVVTLDGDKGTITAGRPEGAAEAEPEEPVEAVRPDTPVKPMTATEVKVNVSIPEAAERAAATGADGVGLLRIEHVVLSLGKTPERYITDHGPEAYVDELVEAMRGVAEEFYPRPVRARTLDAPTDEFRELEGGEDEPREHNPMLGWRGIRRSLDKPDVFQRELEAFAELYELGYDNVEIMFPLVNDAEDAIRAKQAMQAAGIDPEARSWGVMIETPASALGIEELAQTGIDFASFGTNDLTQYTLAVDRNNGNVADRFDELHPAVLKLIGDVIDTCREYDVDTSICGQAGSKPEMVEFLVEKGITS
ncbi:MAG: phosphoenolpyruvate synthase, partial [Halobaculum sp.]